MNFADRVQEITTVTSTSTILLGGATSGYRPFLSASTFKAGDTDISACIVDASGNWEMGLYTLTDSTHLTRTAILASSNSNAAVTFVAGNKNIFCTLPADYAVRMAQVRDTSFVTSIPLTRPGQTYMPQQIISGPLTFTPAAGAVRGALVYVRLVADGANVPNFSAFKEWGGSMGYDNRSGYVNEVQFYHDGYDYWFTVTQAANAVPLDVLAPTISTAAVAANTPTTLTLTASEALDTTNVPATSAFTVTGHTVSAVAVAGSTVTLTVSAFLNAEARNVAYVQPATSGLRDLAGNLMSSFSGLSVTNNVPLVAASLTLTGATTISTGTASTYTVALSPVGGVVSGTAVFTPFVTGVAGTLNPTSINLTTAAPSATFTFTPSATGTAVISGTNNASLTNPTNLTATVTVPPDLTAPVFAGAVVANASPTIVQVTMSEALAASVPPTSAFTISSRTVTGVSISGSVVSLTVNSAFVYGDNATVAYTPPGANPRIQDAAGNASTSFSSAITNNVAATGSDYPRMINLSATTIESGTGPYTYTGNGGVNTSDTGGISPKSLPANTDGWIEFLILAVHDIYVGFRHINSPTIYSNLKYALQASDGSGSVPQYYRRSGSGPLSTLPQAGDHVRVARVGTNHRIQVARAGSPTSFTDIDSLDYGSAPQMWMQVILPNTAAVQLLAWSGFA